MELAPDRTALVLVDLQERLAAAMPAEALARTVRNAGILLEMARRFRMPVIVSEQYPRGLGPTLPVIEQALAGLEPGQLGRLEKLSFSVCGEVDFAGLWQRLGRPRCVVAGMESHVCVYQSVRALLAQGVEVHVPQDAVISRSLDNWRTGVRLMERLGAVASSTETVVFDVLQRAGTDDFKALSRLIR